MASLGDLLLELVGLEAALNRALDELIAAEVGEAQQQAWQKLLGLIRSRSPERVAEMESARLARCGIKL
jgi:hypothetical protein